MAVETSRIFELGYKRWEKKFKGTAYKIWTISLTEAINAFRTSKIVKILVGMRIVILIIGLFKLVTVGFFNVTFMLVLDIYFGSMMSSNFLPLVADKSIFEHLFAAILGTQFGFFDVVLIGFVGAGMIANDKGYNSITLYLSRPISKWEYILGKYGALFIYVITFTWLPTTLYFFSLEAIMKRTFAQLFVDILSLYLPVMLSGFINGLFITTLVLALSSMTRKSLYVGMITLAINPLSLMLSQIMRNALGLQFWYLFSIPITLKIIQLWLMGIPPAHFYIADNGIINTNLLPHINVAFCFIYISIITLLFMYILIRAIKKMEITE